VKKHENKTRNRRHMPHKKLHHIHAPMRQPMPLVPHRRTNLQGGNMMEECKHEWEDEVSIATTVEGEGHLYICCRICGHLRMLEDT